MASFRDLLLRLRPVGAPGPASGVGVPVDRRDSVEQELEPVFAQLSAVTRQCHDIRARASAEAAATVKQAEERARVLLAEASSAAAAGRAQIAATVRVQAQAEVTELVAEANRHAARVRSVADEQLGPRVEQVLARVRADLSNVDGSAG
jgi:hypothetical protein